jgi:hypothetical protein
MAAEMAYVQRPRPINCAVGRDGQWCQALAIQRIYARLLERKIPAFLVNFIHDELVLEVCEDLVDEVSFLAVDEMTKAFLALFKPYKPEPVARGLVEVGAGYDYAHAK